MVKNIFVIFFIFFLTTLYVDHKINVFNPNKLDLHLLEIDTFIYQNK